MAIPSQFVQKLETILSPVSDSSFELNESVSSTTSKGTSHFPIIQNLPLQRPDLLNSRKLSKGLLDTSEAPTFSKKSSIKPDITIDYNNPMESKRKEGNEKEKVDCVELPIKVSDSLLLESSGECKLLASSNHQTLGRSLRNTDHQWITNYKKLENEKLKLEKHGLETKIALKTQIKNLKMKLKEGKERLNAMTQKYEAEMEQLKNQMGLNNEEFYIKLSEKENEVEKKIKEEFEIRGVQAKAELVEVLKNKENDANRLKERLSKLKKQLKEERYNTEKIKVQLKENFEEQLRNQARAQLAFERETMQRIEAEKVEEVRKMKERYRLDLEYTKYRTQLS